MDNFSPRTVDSCSPCVLVNHDAAIQGSRTGTILSLFINQTSVFEKRLHEYSRRQYGPMPSITNLLLLRKTHSCAEGTPDMWKGERKGLRKGDYPRLLSHTGAQNNPRLGSGSSKFRQKNHQDAGMRSFHEAIIDEGVFDIVRICIVALSGRYHGLLSAWWWVSLVDSIATIDW